MNSRNRRMKQWRYPGIQKSVFHNQKKRLFVYILDYFNAVRKCFPSSVALATLYFPSRALRNLSYTD